MHGVSHRLVPLSAVLLLGELQSVYTPFVHVGIFTTRNPLGCHA